MNVVEATRYYYPEHAKAGWCFATNSSARDDEFQHMLVKIISMYSHMKASRAMADYSETAWTMEGEEYRTGFPVFVKVEDTYVLRRLRLPMSERDRKQFKIDEKKDYDEFRKFCSGFDDTKEE